MWLPQNIMIATLGIGPRIERETIIAVQNHTWPFIEGTSVESLPQRLQLVLCKHYFDDTEVQSIDPPTVIRNTPKLAAPWLSSQC
jgi:hypothetical protein